MIKKNINSICYTVLLIIIFILSISTYNFKMQSLKKDNIINNLSLDLQNTNLNLRRANININDANNNLKKYIELNNKLNEQMQKLKMIKLKTNDIREEFIAKEIEQANCFLLNIDKEGECVDGVFKEF